jgi:hypothetical protein
MDASYLARFGSLIGARGRYVATGRCVGTTPRHAGSSFFLQDLSKHLCCWSTLLVPNLLLQYGHIQALYLFFVPKIWCQLQRRCCVNIMLCTFLHNYLIHTTWPCCSQRLIFTTNQKVAKCPKQSAPPRGHVVSSSKTTRSYLIWIYLRYDWNHSPARVEKRMSNCANGHGVSNTATRWCAWVWAKTK